MPVRPQAILSFLSILTQGVKNSIVKDSADNYLQLSGDVSAPGANQTYGTNSSGVKGWKADASVTIPDGTITNAKLVNEAQATIKGRAAGAGTGVPQDLSAVQVKTLLAITGTDVANTPAGSIAATTVQAAINELDTEKQPLDSDLTAIAALIPSNDDLIQRKAGAWTNRTPAQVKTDLVLVKGDVGLGNVDNTSDANKPVSTAQATADGLRVLKAGDTMSGPLAMGANKITGLADGSNAQDAVTKSQLDASTSRSIVNIGDWNMDSTSSVTVNHGIADFTKIRGIEVMIRNDADNNYLQLDSIDSSGNIFGGLNNIGATTITLLRVTGRAFDGTGYDSTSFNRGFVTIFYTT